VSASASAAAVDDVSAEDPRLDALPGDQSRGTWAMALTIVTEALLFVCLFFAYFYLGHENRRWPPEPPKIALALIMLLILLVSSATLHAAERQLRHGGHRAARALLWLTIVLGGIFVGVQVQEYRDHLAKLRPTTNAYGSLFYVITSFHALHLGVGLLMLLFVACLRDLRPAESPHRPLHNAALYWHFVDAVWVFVVGLLYLLPRWGH
jgi:cytochrome c oxidase subunit 3/cytochrome c oxidase subunit I+III